MNNRPTVAVLMATYNGEKYLKEQIDSILNQKDVDVHLFVADDKSSDDTQKILKKYKEKFENFDYYVNASNKNFTYNFIDLIFSIKSKAFDYYALSDQDDVWLDDKLISAIEMIRKANFDNGCLYCSNSTLVDENLIEHGKMQSEYTKRMTKDNFLVWNIGTGCTMVMDNVFYKTLVSYYPKNIYLHDYWVFLIGVFVSNFIYDSNSHICYRQHSNNQIGAFEKEKVSFRKKVKLYTHMNLNPQYSVTKLLKELLNGYRDVINKEDIKKIEDVAFYKENFIKWMKLLFSKKIRGEVPTLNYMVKVLFRNV